LRNQKGKKKNYLAGFLRYGFFTLFVSALFILKLAHATTNSIILVFGISLFLYGTYFLIGRLFKFKHLYRAMQHVYNVRAPYDSAYAEESCFSKTTAQDLLLTGYFFTIISILGTVVFYFRL